jgi:MFS family permease
LSVAFTLGAAGITLFQAKIIVHFKAKWTYIWTVFLFEAGSAICGASNNMSALIVGRILCGIGGVGMYLGVLTLLSALTIQERSWYVGFTGLVWGLGTVIGPVLSGGFFVSTATWQWAFYINLYLSRHAEWPSPTRIILYLILAGMKPACRMAIANNPYHLSRHVQNE